MIREKQELIPTLKVKVEEDDDTSVELKKKKQVSIVEIKDIETKYKTKTIAVVQDSDGNKYQVFLNSRSLNNLIDAFGKDDTLWKGRLCDLVVENAPAPYEKQKMIVFKPVV